MLFSKSVFIFMSQTALMTFIFCTALEQESQNWPGKTLANWMTLEKEGGHTFWNFNCVFIGFYSFSY